MCGWRGICHLTSPLPCLVALVARLARPQIPCRLVHGLARAGDTRLGMSASAGLAALPTRWRGVGIPARCRDWCLGCTLRRRGSQLTAIESSRRWSVMEHYCEQARMAVSDHAILSITVARRQSVPVLPSYSSSALSREARKRRRTALGGWSVVGPSTIRASILCLTRIFDVN